MKVTLRSCGHQTTGMRSIPPLPKVAMMPYGYRQKHSMHDFGYTTDEAGEQEMRRDADD